MRKPVASSMSTQDGKPVHLAPLDSPLFSTWPCLMKHLAVTRYDDGQSRWPGTAILRTEGSSWKCILKDPTTALQLLCTATTFDDVLALAELLLGAEQAPWEPDPNAWSPTLAKKKRG